MNNQKLLSNKPEVHCTLRNRIYALMKKHNINGRDLSHQINVPNATLNRLLVGAMDDPKLSILEAISDYFGVTINYLLGNDRYQENGAHRLGAIYQVPIINWDKVAEVDVYLKSLTDENYEDWITLDQAFNKNIFALRTTKSMSPKFSVNTILVVDPNEIMSDGDLIIVLLKEKSIPAIRELIIEEDYYLINPNNPNSEKIILDNSVETVGVVTETRYKSK